MNRVFISLILAAIAMSGCDRGQPAATASQAAAPNMEPTAQARGRWPFDSAGTEAASRGDFDPAAAMKRNYYVVFDASGSMSGSKCSGNESKLDVAKRAFVEFSARLPSDANLGLTVFDDGGIREIIPIRVLDREAARQAIAPIRAGGGTPLAESMRAAYGALTIQAQRQLGYGEYHLVVVTDGEASGEDPQKIVNIVLGDSPVVLHTIGFCIGQNHSLNQPGRVVYRSADNPAELAQGLADVLAEAPAFDVKAFK